MNPPDSPTPRTDAAWAQTFDANGFLSGRGNAASQMRDECATLERELETENTNRNHIIEKGAALERELTALTAEVKRMTHAYEYDHKCLYEVRDRCHLWKQRAEKAEAELAKYLSACPASPTEEERKRCQQWWSISGKAQ